MINGVMEQSDIVIDRQEGFIALIEDLGNVVTLSFYTNPEGNCIQGHVDETFELIYDYKISLDIENAEVLGDDGFLGVYLDDLTEEERQEAKPRIVEYLTAFYNEYRKRFERSLKRDLRFMKRHGM